MAVIVILYKIPRSIQIPQAQKNFLLLALNQPSNRPYKPTAQVEKSARKGKNCKIILLENVSRAENCSVTLCCLLP